MKTIKVIVLAAVVLGAFVAVNAQDRATVKAYESWRAEIAKQHGGSMPDHYALASVTQRKSATQASIAFLAVGRMPSLNLAICPLTITRDANGKVANVKRGEQVFAKQDLGEGSHNTRSDLATVLPVNAENNAIEVKWTFLANGKPAEQTMIVPLENAPRSSVMGVTRPVGGTASR